MLLLPKCLKTLHLGVYVAGCRPAGETSGRQMYFFFLNRLYAIPDEIRRPNPPGSPFSDNPQPALRVRQCLRARIREKLDY